MAIYAGYYVFKSREFMSELSSDLDTLYRYFIVLIISNIFAFIAGLILAIGLFIFYDQSQFKINRLMGFGLLYFFFSDLSSLSYFAMLFFGDNLVSLENNALFITLRILGLVAMIIVFIFFYNRKKEFQQNKFERKSGNLAFSSFRNYLKDRTKKNGSKRLLNYILDSIFILIIASPLFNSTILSANSEEAFLIYGLFLLYYFAYYFLMEAICGQTLGKMITGTAVQFQGKNSFWGAFLRTLSRFIPFEKFSFLVYKGHFGWHDELTGTYVAPLEDDVIENDEIAIEDHIIEKLE